MSKDVQLPTHYLEPARTVVAKLGGIQAAAEAAGVHFSRVYGWMYSREKRGTGGIIPAEHQAKLLAWAKAHGRRLKPADFFAVADAA